MNIIRYSTPSTCNLAPVFNFGNRSPWAGLETEMDRLFQSALLNTPGIATHTNFPIDLYEDKANTYLRAELPGVRKEDLNIEIADGFLTIQASRKIKTGNSEQSTTQNRSIMVGEELQADKVSASLENGVLTVTLPKKEESKPKKFSVSVN